MPSLLSSSATTPVVLEVVRREDWHLRLVQEMNTVSTSSLAPTSMPAFTMEAGVTSATSWSRQRLKVMRAVTLQGPCSSRKLTSRVFTSPTYGVTRPTLRLPSSLETHTIPRFMETSYITYLKAAAAAVAGVVSRASGEVKWKQDEELKLKFPHQSEVYLQVQLQG